MSISAQRPRSLTLARGATDAARNEQASGVTRVSVEWTALFGFFCFDSLAQPDLNYGLAGDSDEGSLLIKLGNHPAR